MTIRYDPRDMAEIRVYHQERFLCRAVCQELAGETVSLKEIIRARRRRTRELHQQLAVRQSLIDQVVTSSVPAMAHPVSCRVGAFGRVRWGGVRLGHFGWDEPIGLRMF